MTAARQPEWFCACTHASPDHATQPTLSGTDDEHLVEMYPCLVRGCFCDDYTETAEENP